MAGLTGLFQRGTVYYLRVVLPLNHPLRKSYKNGSLVASLGCCSHREATLRGTIRRAEVLLGGTEGLKTVMRSATKQSFKWARIPRQLPTLGQHVREIYRLNWLASEV